MPMSANDLAVNTSISEEEAALYDRQIRLWGVDAQNKLKNAKLLLIGMTPLASEISKNMVLAGVAVLTIVDDAIVTNDDSRFNFLIPTSSIGMNRYDAIIIADNLTSNDLMDWLSVYEEVVRVGGKPQLFYTLTVGCFGVSVVDLGAHNFLAEDVITKKRDVSQKWNRKPVVHSAATETVFTKKCVTYPKFQVFWDNKNLNWLNSRVSKGFLLAQLIHRCATSEAPFTIEYLTSQWQSVANELKVDECLLTEEDLECCCGPAVPAVSAVLGGVISQEAIRAITGKGTAHGNWYFLNGIECSVTVSWIPPDASITSESAATC